MSAATLGLEWTKTSLVSVRARLQAETDALMKSLKLISGEDNSGAIDQLCRRGVLLKDQHKLLSSLFKRFKLQVKKIQRLCHGDGGYWLSEVELSHSADDDRISSLRSDDSDTSMVTSLVPSEAVLCKKREGTCDNAAVDNSEYSLLAVSQRNQHIFTTQLLHAASLQSVGKNVSDANVTNRPFCDVTECRATCGMSVSTEAVSGRLDGCHERAACGANDDDERNCWADGRQAQSQIDACCRHLTMSRPTSVMTTVSPAHSCTLTCSHIDTASDCGHDDRVRLGVIGQVAVTKEMSAPVTVPCTLATAAAAGVGSTLSVQSFSSLPVHDSLPDSQPLCKFTGPSVKKLHLPPPSPSLLSMSSGSPQLSPLLPPASHHQSSSVSRHPVPQHLATTHHKLPVSQPLRHYLQTTDTSSLPDYTVLTHASTSGPPSKVFVVSSVPRSITLPAPVSTGQHVAVGQFAAGDVSASQNSQKFVRPSFSLRQLITDGVIYPGHNVLSVQNPVIVYCQFCYMLHSV